MLKLKLFTIAYSGQAGHRDGDAKASSLCGVFTWKGVNTDANDFLSNCFLGVFPQIGSKTIRLFAAILPTLLTNMVLHFDYLHLSDSEDGSWYVFVVNDDCG